MLKPLTFFCCCLTLGTFAQDFIKITTGPAVNDGAQSYGSSFIDFDRDGDIDLFVANFTNTANLLFENDGNGNFSTLSYPVLTANAGSSLGHSWVDVDSDCYNDLYISNGGANGTQNNEFYFYNDFVGQYQQIAIGAVALSNGNSQTSNFGDYDNDGDLDLFVANLSNENNFFFINSGNGVFSQNTSSIISTSGGSSNDANWVDIDNDGDLDLFVANQSNQSNFVYINNNGNFTALTTGVIVTDLKNSFGSVWGDYDNDGDLDLYVCNNGQSNDLYRNDGSLTFTKINTGAHVTDVHASYGAAWVDYDNDGDLDLFVSNAQGQNNRLYQNNGSGNFTSITTGDIVNDGGISRGCNLDCYVTNRTNTNNFLYKNNIGSNKNWFHVDLKATTSNKNCIGAVVKVKANIGGNDVWQMRELSSKAGYCAQESPTLEFGLNNASTIDSVIVYWPTSNTTCYYTNLGVNQKLTFYEFCSSTPITTFFDTLCSGNQTLAFDGFNYNWYDDSTLTNLLDFDSVLTVNLFAGDTSFFLQAPDTNLCFNNVVELSFNVLNAPDANLGNDTLLCASATLILYTAQENGVTYTWSDGSTANSLNVTQAGTYSLTAANVSCTSSDTIIVNVISNNSLPELSDTSACNDKPFQLTLSNASGVNYIWSNNSTGPSLTTFEEGNYTVIQQSNCGADTASFQLSFEDCDCNCECDIYIPNAFTPDGNEHNPVFRPEHTCENISLFQLQIFNRYGELIFESKDPHGTWDGTYMGKIVPDDIYIYLLEITVENGSKEKYAGHISVLK